MITAAPTVAPAFDDIYFVERIRVGVTKSLFRISYTHNNDDNLLRCLPGLVYSLYPLYYRLLIRHPFP